jgi:hypothetical protein
MRTARFDVSAFFSPVATAPRKPSAPQAVVPAPVPIHEDSRSMSNTRAHLEVPYTGPALTPAKARKERQRAMAACMCRLCALALSPPKTFAEGEGLGFPYERHDALALLADAMGWTYEADAPRRHLSMVRQGGGS